MWIARANMSLVMNRYPLYRDSKRSKEIRIGYVGEGGGWRRAAVAQAPVRVTGVLVGFYRDGTQTLEKKKITLKKEEDKCRFARCVLSRETGKYFSCFDLGPLTIYPTPPSRNSQNTEPPEQCSK